jgi:hypothetical protein
MEVFSEVKFGIEFLFLVLNYFLEDPGVDGRIMLKWIFKRLGGGGADWIDLAQDRDRWQALVYTVMNLWVP